MPTYSFVVTKTALREAEVAIEADTFQEACKRLAQQSQDGDIEWISSVDMGGDETVVRAIDKDGQRVPGVFDPITGAPGWYGLNGIFDIEDMPPEFMASES